MSEWKQLTGKERSGFDTEGEQRAVNRNDYDFQKSAGFTDRLQEMNTDMVVQQAVNDRMTLEVKAQREAAEEAMIEAAETALAKEDKKDGEDELEALRAARRKAMKDKFQQDKENKIKGHGEYTEIVEEEFLKTVTGSKRVVVHFYHRQFERCKIMDMHLRKMAPKFLGTRFVTLNAEKSPFFVQKLAIKTLPTAVYFIDGVAVAKQMGFQGLPNGDEFTTTDFARTLRDNEMFDRDFDSDDEQW